MSPDTCHLSPVFDGSMNKNCWGTYLHGIFENDIFRRGVINLVRQQKGLSNIEATTDYSGTKDRAIDNLAGIVRQNIDMDFLKGLIKL